MAKSRKNTPAADFREAFLAKLCERLAAPLTEWPTARWWTSASLNRLFRQIRDALEAEGSSSPEPHVSLLTWLHRLGLERPLHAEGETFHLIDVGAAAGTDVDPYELLMASRPRGVVCYFSAVAFHSLTTQHVAHHHVAELTNPSPAAAARERPTRGGRSDAASKGASLPALGERLFELDGAPYYATRRSSRLVPGVQTRGHGPRSEIRITTLEQTLLDALFKPFHAGGPEVVFEAWGEAFRSARVDEERMADHLERMQYPATTRRVGAMLDAISHVPAEPLRGVLEAARRNLDPEAPFAIISLLPGVEYSNLNGEWLVQTP